MGIGHCRSMPLRSEGCTWVRRRGPGHDYVNRFVRFRRVAPVPRPELPVGDREAKARLPRAGAGPARRGAPRRRPVPESGVHRIESAARPDLGLLELLRELSGGLELGSARGAAERRCESALRAALERDHPDRTPEPGDERDLEALSLALPRCDLVTCDAFMADLIHRARLDVWFPCEVFTGRRGDVERLRRRLEELAAGN